MLLISLLVRDFRDFRGSKKVFPIGYGVLFACLDTAISRKEVEDLAQGIIDWHKGLEPAGDTQVVFRDSAFANDIAQDQHDRYFGAKRN